MTEQEILIQEGMNLLYNGMIVVFSFLLLLIISVNLLRILVVSIIREKKIDPSETNSSSTARNDTHHRILKKFSEVLDHD